EYSWPGNVREIRNVVERAVLLAENETLDPGDFDGLTPLRHAPGQPAAAAAQAGISLPSEGLRLDDVERQLITLAHHRSRGNQMRAAALLCLHRDQIRYRMEKYGLLMLAS